MKKRILSLLLALVLVMQFGIVAFAEESNRETSADYYSEQETKAGKEALSVIDIERVAKHYADVQEKNGSLSFCLMKHLMGVSKEKTEAEARAFHNIDESWQSIQATNDDVSAMLFFPADRSSHFYSIYCKRKGLSKGFFFRIGGTISEISSECVQFVFEDNNSQIYASMNKQKICKVEIDDGDHVNTISLNEDDPFILVFPSNAGNVTLYNTYGEVVAPRKRYVP